MGKMTEETKLIKFNLMKKTFKVKGCELLETEYKKAKIPLKYKTICNHIRYTSWNNFTTKVNINDDILYCLNCQHTRWYERTAKASYNYGLNRRIKTTLKLIKENKDLELLKINKEEKIIYFKCKKCNTISSKTLRNFYYIPYCSSKRCTELRTKKTYLKNWGKEYYTQTDIYHQNQYELKKKNKSHNSSKVESKFKSLIIENKIEFNQHYKSKLYPFVCDFYLIDYDLYIELNFHWTHGKEPFNLNTHKEVLETWKNKSKEINYKGELKIQYLNAINTWTKRDTKKRSLALKNSLNYIEIFKSYNLENFIDFLKNEYKKGYICLK